MLVPRTGSSSSRSYALVAAILTAIVLGLFLWQPWNANGGVGFAPSSSPAPAGNH
ncbi:MAG: LPXTG cell wall anchor domain-containing protein [Candidatus Eremiobacteraeota bacterium]|nr:LPXTG cell wall anchor domain-containing protein [Candidatus Eremiobacteraeota bacterium]MBV8355991.1 LPXTG cell wall anchor domain-containing protein [Candidatus Eremiobacteraeota bacterium]